MKYEEISLLFVTPAQAGVQALRNWMPACAGMTRTLSTASQEGSRKRNGCVPAKAGIRPGMTSRVEWSTDQVGHDESPFANLYRH